MSTDSNAARSAEVVLPAGDLDATVAFFTGELGLGLDLIFPADAPRVAVLEGLGLRLRLDRGYGGDPGRLRVEGDRPRELTAPNGTVVEIVAPPTARTPQFEGVALAVHRASDATWGAGRAGMEYRDLVPGRLGGELIASQIRIPTGGPVPDYVHFHEVAFQLIYCRRGWVWVVYEDQGEPFVMGAGDAVLQPPTIRHRVLESGDGLEVVELTCPAEHPTRADRALELPTGKLDPQRLFGGQRFVRHRREGAPIVVDGAFERRDLELGVACAEVLRAREAGATVELPASAGAAFLFVLAGRATVAERAMAVDDAAVVPLADACPIRAESADLELLTVRLR